MLEIRQCRNCILTYISVPFFHCQVNSKLSYLLAQIIKSVDWMKHITNDGIPQARYTFKHFVLHHHFPQVISYLMKALKCKPSAQFAYNYSINVLSKCSSIISHRSSIFEGRHIDLRRLTYRSSKVDISIFESRHIDLRRSKAETSH